MKKIKLFILLLKKESLLGKIKGYVYFSKDEENADYHRLRLINKEIDKLL